MESFSSQIKTELSTLKIKRREDALALLSAFTLGIGALKYVPEERCWGVRYVLKNKDAVELAAKLAGQYYALKCRISEIEHERLNATNFELLIYGEAQERFMLDTGLMSAADDNNTMPEKRVPQAAVRTETQQRMFIRGLFLACGMVTSPEKAYHAEFVVGSEALCKTADEILKAHGIEPKRTRRKDNFILYLKEGDMLENLLAFLGASEAMMRVSNERILRQAKNEANRGCNCINANLERATRAARAQTEDIRLVLKTLGLEGVPEELRAVAEARLNNSELSLAELADELEIGRSAVNYRLKKLAALAAEIRGGETPR